MIIDDEDDQNEIYRESLPVLSEAIKSGPKALKVLTILFGNIYAKEKHFRLIYVNEKG